MKHARGSPVTVRVDFGAERLHLVIRDHGGRGTCASAPGNGLLGMRQRADLLGGELRTGPVPDGGFVVDCVVPVPAQEVARDSAGAGR
jgi:signal transduction histidine kinase